MTPDAPALPASGVPHAFRAEGEPWAQETAAAGELLVARLRVLVTGILFLIQLLPGPVPLRIASAAVSALAFGLALAILVLSRRFFRPWVVFATSALDVTMITAALATFALIGLPHQAVNSRIAFETYFLVIAAAGLRYDARACMLTGALAFVQNLALVAAVSRAYDLNDARYAPFTYGTFSWTSQISRLILLVAATVITTHVVTRSRRLWTLAATDRLTGLANRGVFEDRLAEEEARARRYDRPFTVAAVDVDHFKRFNDTYGHGGGDCALRAVAVILRGAVRRSDVVARYGGEEFALLLPETTADHAVGKMDELRAAMAASVLQECGPEARLTLSLGVASWPADGKDAAAVLSMADRRLYQAKALGRNRVVGPEPSSAVSAG